MTSIEGYDAVGIASAGGEVQARFVPDANMLCPSLTRRDVELLHAGLGVRAYAQRGKTMGIPLLHPWANRLATRGYHAAGKDVVLPAPEGRYGLDPNGLPIHGALPGLLRWRVQETGEDRVSAALDWSAPELLELFPYEHELVVEAQVGDDGLRLATTLRATGDDEVPVSFGYHPYLDPPGDLPRARWRVRLGASERLVLDQRMIPTGEIEPLDDRSFRLGDQSWDDGLSRLSAPPEFAVAAGPTTLTVTFDEGYGFAQVFAPPEQDFICFEPMTAPSNALVSGAGLRRVAPGAEYRAAFTITFADNDGPST